MKYIILDTETTCLDFNKLEIWQFSGMVVDLEEKKISKFDYKFKTKNELSYEARVRCNITNEIVSSYPEFDPNIIIKELLVDEEDVYYIGHNVSFDKLAIMNVLNRYKMFNIGNLRDNNKWIDTLKLTKAKYNDLIVKDISGENPISYKLNYLFHLFHLYNNEEDLKFHDSMFDVEITWRLFRYICKENKWDIKYDIEEILKTNIKPILLKIFPFGKYKGKNIAEIYNMHTPETDSYFGWLANQEICDINSPNCNKDLIYTLEQL